MLSTYVEKSFTWQSLSLLHMSSTVLAMSTPSNSRMPFNIFLRMLMSSTVLATSMPSNSRTPFNIFSRTLMSSIVLATLLPSSSRTPFNIFLRTLAPLRAYINTSASPCGASEQWRSWCTHRLSESPTGRSSLDLLLQLQLMVHHRFACCAAHPSERPRSSLGLPPQLQHTVHHWFARCATYCFERPRSSLGLPLQLLLMVHHRFARCAACPSKRPRSFLGLPLQLQLTTAHDPSSVCTLHHLSFPKAQKLSTPSRMLHCSPFQKVQKLSTPSCVLRRFPFQKTQKLSRPFTTTTAGPLLVRTRAHLSHTYTLGAILWRDALRCLVQWWDINTVMS